MIYAKGCLLIIIKAALIYSGETLICLNNGKHDVELFRSDITDHGDGTYTLPYELAQEKGFA